MGGHDAQQRGDADRPVALTSPRKPRRPSTGAGAGAGARPGPTAATSLKDPLFAVS